MVSLIGFISIVGIFTLCILLFLLFLLSSKKSQLCVDDDQTIEIFKIIEALREICPVGSSRGWSLIDNHCSLRCWQRSFPFQFFGSQINVFASSTRLNVPTVCVLNVIADVTTWPEWDPAIHHHPLQAEISDDSDLHGDCYMQCDQLVAMTVSNNPKPGILMHRFGNLEENGVGWIFLWHLSHLNWCFFLAQPLETVGGIESNHCLLTMISGKNPYSTTKEDMALQLATKLRNLKDAVSRSRLQIRPFVLVSSLSNLSNPHLPTIQSALSDLSDKPCVLLRSSKNSLKPRIPSDIKQSNVLSVVPFSTSKPITLLNVKGFVLVSKKPNFKAEDKEIDQLEKAKVRKRQKNQLRSICQEVESKEEDKLASKVSVMPTVTITQVDDDSPDHRKKSIFNSLINRARRLSDATVSDREIDHPSDNSIQQKSFSEKFRKRSNSAGSKPEKKKDSTNNNESGNKFLGSLLARAKKLSVSSGNVGNNISKSPSIKELNKDLSQDLKTENKSETRENDVNISKNNQVIENESTSNEIKYNVIQSPLASDGYLKEFENLGSKCISDLLSEVKSALKTVKVNITQDEPKNMPDQWIYHGSHKDLTMMMKVQDTPIKIISYLCYGSISVKPLNVCKTLSNPLSRFIYDDTVKKITVVKNLSNEQKIVHTYHEVVTLLKKESQEFCLLHTVLEKNSKFILAYQSVESELCPLQNDVIRGKIYPSGWIVEFPKKNKKQCNITFLEQLVVPDSESLLIEEMGNNQAYYIINLKKYLTVKLF